jgi:hypothetical protein
LDARDTADGRARDDRGRDGVPDDDDGDDDCGCGCGSSFGSTRSARVEKERNGEGVQWVEDDDDGRWLPTPLPTNREGSRDAVRGDG